MTDREVEAISDVLRHFRSFGDLCPTDRAQATNPRRRGSLRSGEPGRLAGGRA